VVGVTWRHLAGAFLGALAAWVVIVLFLASYSLLSGSTALAPFQGPHTIGPFSGTQGTAVLVLIDFVIPLIGGVLFVAALAVVSRTRLTRLAFTSRPRALAEGALLGLVVFVTFYVPVLYQLSHPTLAQAVLPLVEGFLDHLAFGAVLGLVIYLVGGPVPVRPPVAPPSAPSAIHP
jgi:hypothetical protein